MNLHSTQSYIITLPSTGYNNARPEVRTYTGQHFHSPLIVVFGPHVDTTCIACTPPDIIKPGDIVRYSSMRLRGDIIKMSKNDMFSNFFIF